ncbi:hypothetical protein [Mycolicibacterium palauense]|uniref:hypothetical protein n=1 Tax=Mycolicibacterium palauense TaxID=2034511 RepID=UPI000BFEF3CA|nr:hypothetical protein [Mycolicibacterium palauense]
MALTRDNGLIRNAEGGSAYFYADPNPGLAKILTGDHVFTLVSDYVTRVMETYIAKLYARSPDSDHDATSMANSVYGEVFIGGYRDDRWVGQITVAVEYAAADEFGRHSYNPYEGSHDLRDSLYEHLPAI